MANKKLGLGRAGDQVHQKMGNLSDRLMGLEQSCQFRMEGVFTNLLGDVEAVLSAGYSGNRTAVVLTELAEEAVIGTRSAYGRLSVDAVEAAKESILSELLVCEATLAARYEGLAREAVRTAEFAKTRLASYSLREYSDNSLTTVEWFHDQLSVELQASTAANEDGDTLLSRIISPTPVKGLPKHQGRGLWWKPLEHCHRVAREVEFTAVNTFRQWSMNAFNELGKER